MPRKVITRSNYEIRKGKKYKGKSETVQDDSQSVKDMLNRFIQTGKAEGKAGAVYVDDPDHDDVDGEKFRRMDLADQEDVITGIKAMRQRLKILEQEYQDEMKEREMLAIEAKKIEEKPATP